MVLERVYTARAATVNEMLEVRSGNSCEGLAQ